MKNIIFVAVLLVAGAFAFPIYADAAELDGFAWASTVGWISMNCSNTSTCTSDDPVNGIDYAVTIDTDDNSVNGWAWSPNVGWIKFGGLSGFPSSGNGTVNNNVEVVGTVSSAGDFVLTGWARACAPTLNTTDPSLPGDCSSMTTADNTGGWDGWISMSGNVDAPSGGSYGVVFQNGEVTNTSFAWGGPNTMGWIDFSPNNDAGDEFDNGVGLRNNTDIIITSVGNEVGNANAAGVYDTVTFTPVVTGIPVGETVRYDLTLGALSINGDLESTVDGLDYNPIQLSNIPFNIVENLVFEVDMIPAPDGVVEEIDEVNIYDEPLVLALPAPTMSITGPDLVRSSEQASIEWEVSAPYDLTCSVQGRGFPANYDFNVTAGVTYSDDRTSAAIVNASEFVLACVNATDTYTETHLVDVVPTFQEI